MWSMDNWGGELSLYSGGTLPELSKAEKETAEAEQTAWHAEMARDQEWFEESAYICQPSRDSVLTCLSDSDPATQDPADFAPLFKEEGLTHKVK